MTRRLKKIGATLAVLATVCFNPIPIHGQEIDQSADEAVATDISQLRHPA